MKEIPLTQGQVALVDDCDYALVSCFKWCAWKSKHHKTFYAVTNVLLANGKRSTMFMHRFLLNAPPHLESDHIDGNGLNNQRGNLRFCTSAQNNFNMRTQRKRSSPYKGVSPNGVGWLARIGCGGKRFCLGTYKTPEEAAHAYDKAARELYGDFALPNFPVGEG